MRSILSIVAILAIAFVSTASISVAAEPPAWAYAISPPAPAATPPAAPAAPDTSLKHLPGSTLEFTRAQISDGFGPADWYPGDHPKMPDVVAHGRRPDVRACALCHYPNGKGRPENAGVAGLPAAYFLQQMADFMTATFTIGAEAKMIVSYVSRPSVSRSFTSFAISCIKT